LTSTNTGDNTKDHELCPKPPQVFVRSATGLVRSLNWLDALIMSLAVTGPTYLSYVLQVNFVGGVDPGADITISALIGLAFMIPLGLIYYFFSRALPRSGGDYVWMGRTLFPGIGFVAGWAMWISFLVLLAGTAVIWGSVVLPVFFVTLGYGWGIHSLVAFASVFSSSYVDFFCALLVMAFGILITSFGARVYSRTMIILAGIVGLGTLISLFIVATTSNLQFQNAFNHYGGVGATYSGIISQAQSTGWTYTPVTTGVTLLAVPFGVLLFNGFNYSVYASGEFKSIKNSMLWGILLALLIDAVINIAGIWFSVRMVGYEFNQAATAIAGTSHWPFPVGAWVSLFIPMVTSNPVLLFLIQLSWLLAFVWWMGSLLYVASRYVFAFSFDRMLPVAFADISDRFHFPLKAVALSCAVGAIFIYLTAFTTYIGTYLNSTTIFAIVWVIVSISAVIVPYKRKELVADLPGARWPVPLISICGIISIFTMAATLYFSFTTPAVGPSTPFSDVILAFIFGAGIVIFIGRHLYLRSKGINLSLAAKEIPPE
jgi:basic amino acid/polyamine antiporter, APA family